MSASASTVTRQSLSARFALWSRRELREIAPPAIFFLSGFALILLMVKLFLTQYAIQLNVLSNALLGAFIAAKVTIVLDKFGWARSRGYPAAVIIAGRTFSYGLAVIVAGIAERLFDGYRLTGSSGGAVAHFAAVFNAGRFFAIVLCVTMLFAAYFTLDAINNRMGKGALYALFFERPPEPGNSGSSKVLTGPAADERS